MNMRRDMFRFFSNLVLFVILLFPYTDLAQENKLPGDKRSIDIILMLDKSGSLNITNGSAEYALQAAKYLVDFIDVYQQKSGFNIRLAFIPFGETVLDGFFPLQELNPDSKEKILEGIKTGNTKKTDFVPPFNKAMHLFTNSKGSRCLIFLFSDGVPDLQREKKSEEYPTENEVLNYFNTSGIKEVIQVLTKGMNVDIEIIGFNDRLYGRKWTKEGNPKFIKKLWDELLKENPGRFHSIGENIFEPTKVVHQILEKSFYGQSPVWSALKKGELAIDLEPFLDWAVFTVIKEGRDDTLVIKNSKGMVFTPDIQGNEGRYLIYHISPPIDEKWTVNLLSNEKAWLGITRRYPEIRFDLEKITHNRRHKRFPLLVGEGELELSCSIFRGDNIIIDKDINLKFDGKNMKNDGKGKYFHIIELPDAKEPLLLKPKIEAFYYTKPIPLRKDITKFAVELKTTAKKIDYYLEWGIGLIIFILILILWLHLKKREKSKAEMNKRIKLFNAFIENSKNLSEKEIHTEFDQLLKITNAGLITIDKENFKSSEYYFCKMFSELIRFGKYQPGEINLNDFLPIFARIKNLHDLFINFLSKVLWKEMWDNAPLDEIIIGIYEIINRFEEPYRILFHIAENSNHVAREIIESMAEIYDTWDDELQQNLKIHLSKIRNAYQKFQGVEKLGVKGYAFWDYLLKLLEKIENTLYLGEIDYPDSSNLEIDGWKKSIDLLKDLNYLENLDYEKALEKIHSSIKECPNRLKGPEARIVLSLLKKWESELKSVSKEPVEIEMSFAPELAIKEEIIKDPSLSLFSILIRNKSNGHAYNVNLMINSKRDGKKEVEIGKVLKHSYCVSKDIFKIHDIEQTEIMASYYFKKESNGKVIEETKTTNLSPNLEYVIEKDSTNEKSPFSLEPYSPGDVFVNRLNDIAKIKSAIESNKSQILVVFGMRMVGKTSLINFLIKILSKEHPNIKCITIPSSIFNRKRPWENEEFLGVLAQTILRENSINNCVARVYHNRNYQDIEKMDLITFGKFMDDLMMVMNNQKLVVFFDDADYFEKKNKGNKKELFPGLKDLLEVFNDIIEKQGVQGKSIGYFDIIFFGCSDVLGDSWSKVFINKEKVSELKLFEKHDVSKIAHIGTGKIPFNTLSLEYLMRITGGHPGLTQYICQFLRNELVSHGNEYKTVSLSILHNVMKKFVNDKHCKRYCSRIVRFSLPPEEGLIFINLLEKVNAFSLEIDASNLVEEKMQGLTKYQFIEVISDFRQSKALRIGVFRLFRDKSFLVKDSIEV